MIPGVPLGELAWLAVAIVAGGIVTGILAGLFGIGGGAIIVPVLYEVFRVIGVGLIRHRLQPAYNPDALAQWVEAALVRPRGTAPRSPAPLRPAS